MRAVDLTRGGTSTSSRVRASRRRCAGGSRAASR